MLNAQCSRTERCLKADVGSVGCVRTAGHTGRHKIRENPDDVFAGGGKVGKRRGLAKLPNPQSAIRNPQSEDDDKSDHIAALCEIATALGMARVQLGYGLAWVNPQTGAAARLNDDASGLYAASIIVPKGDAVAPTPCALMNILGVQGLSLADGGLLYAAGGKLIVQTPSGGLRPARLEMDAALGPAGDGEGR